MGDEEQPFSFGQQMPVQMYSQRLFKNFAKMVVVLLFAGAND